MTATQQQESLSSILASAETTPHPIAAPKPPSTVMLGTGLPSLPKKLVDKILAGEYVDFAELPPARGKARAVPQALEGQIVVVQAADLLQSRRVIPDLATWMQCYAIFTPVIPSKNPARLPDLMAYIIIAKDNTDNIMLWAAICLGFFSFMRAGEFTVPADNAYDSTAHLNTEDISVDSKANPSMARIKLKKSKTDPFRQGVDIYVCW